MKSFQLRKGFTLVEMLIVIAIIAILASVALVSVGGVRKSARDTKRVSDISKLQQQLEVYYSIHGAYPATNAFASFTTEVNMTDPLGNPYAYAAYATNQKYLLGILMEGGTAAAEDQNEFDAYPTGVTGFGIECADPGYCVGN